MSLEVPELYVSAYKFVYVLNFWNEIETCVSLFLLTVEVYLERFWRPCYSRLSFVTCSHLKASYGLSQKSWYNFTLP